jgi:hypothetical protein
MLEENVLEAIELLKGLLQPLEMQNLSPFKGIGSLYNWKYMFPKGPLQWFTVAKDNKDIIESNPFDLLCLCFITQLERKKMTLEEVIKEY